MNSVKLRDCMVVALDILVWLLCLVCSIYHATTRDGHYLGKKEQSSSNPRTAVCAST